jgi:molecular chaperone DnaJ
MRDFYDVLGVARSATQEEIKKAYRLLARKHHPDMNGGSATAEERFKEVNAAFEVLSDAARRGVYDELGPEGASVNWDPAQASARRPPANEGFRSAIWQELGGLDAILDTFFGKGAGRRKRREPRGASAARDPDPDFDLEREPRGRRGRAPTKGADLDVKVEITLAQAVCGAELEVTFDRDSACDTCGGTGESTPRRTRSCPSCGGTGSRRRGSTAACSRCDGRGVLHLECAGCRGQGVAKKRARVVAQIPPGADDGEMFRLSGEGNSGLRGGKVGDLFIDIRVRPHPLVVRHGADLHLVVPITVPEAVRGATVPLTTFDGEVKLKVPPGSQSGDTLRLRGRGVPRLRGRGRGDFFAELQIVLPKGARAKTAASLLEPLYAHNVRKGLVL